MQLGVVIGLIMTMVGSVVATTVYIVSKITRLETLIDVQGKALENLDSKVDSIVPPPMRPKARSNH